MNIFAVRHGQTEGNIAQILQSRTDGKLTAEGIEQAKATALLLAQESFDAIYCSTLGRCKETLSYIAVYHPDVPVVYSQALIELDKGVLEGRQWSDLPTDFYSSAYIDTALPGGESWRNVEDRLKTLLHQIYEMNHNSVLLVTHDGPLRVLHAILGDVSLEDAIKTGYKNAGVYSLKMTEDTMELTEETV